MNADQIFAILVFLSWPPVILYPLIYGTTSPWWRSWIGRALLIKAIGLFILISFTALYQIFGPHYYGRDTTRIVGMTIACIGFWAAFIAMIQIKLEARRNRIPGDTVWRHYHE